MALALVSLAAMCWAAGASSNNIKPNFLLIYMDDLRANADGTERTPTQARLAKSGFYFTHTSPAYPMCGPSRASMLSGRRPDELRVWGNNDQLRGLNPKLITLPQALKQAGYQTVSLGKVFHPGCGDDNDYSWSEKAWHPPFVKPHNHTFYAVPSSFPDDIPELEDGVTFSKAMNITDSLTEPFFLAVGFHRPHLPWVFPERFLAPYNTSADVPLASNPYPPLNSPECAEFTMGTLFNFADFAAMCNGSSPESRSPTNVSCNPFTGPIPAPMAKDMRAAYHASADWTDDLAGRLLDKLEGNSSRYTLPLVVVFVSDHGWKLGEHASWEKQTLWADDTVSPFIIRLPAQLLPLSPFFASGYSGIGSIGGARLSEMVEQIDLAPTVLELAGLPSSAMHSKGYAALPGTSLVPLMHREVAQVLMLAAEAGGVNVDDDYSDTLTDSMDEDASYVWIKNATFAQVTHNSKSKYPHPNWSGTVMGCAIATPHFRYIEWPMWDGKAGRKDFNKVVGRELYDLANDKDENVNVVGDPAHAATVTQLQRQLRRVYDVTPTPVPPTPVPTPPTPTPAGNVTKIYSNGQLEKVAGTSGKRWIAKAESGGVFDIACANQTKLWSHTESILVELPPGGKLVLKLPAGVEPLKLVGFLSMAVHGSPSIMGAEVQMKVLTSSISSSSSSSIDNSSGSSSSRSSSSSSIGSNSSSDSSSDSSSTSIVENAPGVVGLGNGTWVSLAAQIEGGKIPPGTWTTNVLIAAAKFGSGDIAGLVFKNGGGDGGDGVAGRGGGAGDGDGGGGGEGEGRGGGFEGPSGAAQGSITFWLDAIKLE
jgi:iduronate 2-sulfatase